MGEGKVICKVNKSSGGFSADTKKRDSTKKRINKTIKKTIFKTTSKAVMSVSILEFAGELEIFDGKILLLALGVFILTGLIKLAVPEKFRKYVTLLPFALGIGAYAAYAFLAEGAGGFTPHIVSVGFQCGVAATMYYVVYSQFFKRGLPQEAAALTGLLGGIVEPESVKSAVKNILAALKEDGEQLPKTIYEILKANKSEGITAEEIMLAVKNITSTVR
jgi:hypothetical protein